MREPWFDALLVEQIDLALDGGVSAIYKDQPLAQDWARVAKAGEEAGEAVDALIAWTGQNPRKPQRDEAYGELLNELADTALTGIYAMQHFTKDAGQIVGKLWMTAAALPVVYLIRSRLPEQPSSEDTHPSESAESC